MTLQAKERDASERLRRSEAELTSANKRLAQAETALAKARNELGASTSNTVRGIRISSGTPRGMKSRAQGSVFKTAADRVNQTQAEMEGLQQLVADSEGA